MFGLDDAIILKVLKYGDIHVLDEVLLHRYEHGYSDVNILEKIQRSNDYFYWRI